MRKARFELMTYGSLLAGALSEGKTESLRRFTSYTNSTFIFDTRKKDIVMCFNPGGLDDLGQIAIVQVLNSIYHEHSLDAYSERVLRFESKVHNFTLGNYVFAPAREISMCVGRLFTWLKKSCFTEKVMDHEPIFGVADRLLILVRDLLRSYSHVSRRAKEPAYCSQKVDERDYRLIHAIVGLVSESGELAELLKTDGTPIDRQKVKDELGDQFWYLSLALSAMQLTWTDVAEANERKLMARYPSGAFDQVAFDNRDRKAESEAINAPAPPEPKELENEHKQPAENE